MDPVKVSINHYMQKPRTEWVVCHANQIILTVSQIMWAKGVHEILDGEGNVTKKMEQYEQKCIKVRCYDVVKFIARGLFAGFK